MLRFRCIIAFLLLATLLLPLIACSSSSNDPTPITDTTAPVSAPPSEEDEKYAPLDLPDHLDFGGRKFTIVGDYRDYIEGEISVEDLISEPVNDAVYNRELYVEDLLNIELEYYQLPQDQGIHNYLDIMTTAGDSPGDIASVVPQAATWNSESQIFSDLYDMTYIDLNAPWWFDDYTYAASLGNHLFTCCGDLSLSLKRSIYIMFLNKKIAEDEGITDIYQTVFDGKWTLDKLAEVTSGVYHDINGDSAADPEDQYGYITSETSVDPFWGAFDITIFRKDADNFVEYCLDNEKFYNATDKVKALFKQKSTLDVGWREDELYELFAADGGLIAITRLMKAETPIMRNMQSEYGIIPLPKYDESQKEYHTMPSDSYTCFAIPILSEDPEASAAVLDALSWYSYRYVTPAYFDVAMKGKYSNDPETRRMIDIIIAGFTVDIGWVSARYLYEFPQVWRYIASGEYDSGVSAITAKERKLSILLRTYNELFDQYD